MARFAVTPILHAPSSSLHCALLSSSRAALLLACLATIPLANPAFGQPQNSESASGASKGHVPVASDQEQFVAYWTTETGWDTMLELRNNLVAQTLTVTPSLRAPDGTETSLGPITINPRDIQTIDIGAAVGTVAPQLIGTFGSIVLRYQSVSYSNLYALAMIRNIGRPIVFHFDGTGEREDYRVGSREGIWWLPDPSATDYVILTNQGDKALPVVLSVYNANGTASTQAIRLGPRQASRYSIGTIARAAGFTSSYGGFRVSAAANANWLNTLHIVFDTQSGFSALMKTFDHDPQATIRERDYAKTNVWTTRAPMLALSQPDPALAIPVGTTLQPQLFVRNTTGKPVQANLRFVWRGDGSTTGKASGPALQLAPYETRRVDVAALQQQNVLPPNARWTSVILTTNSQPDQVMAVAASYDSTLVYGAQTPFSDQLSFHWVGSEWEYDPLHDSILTVGNGGTAPAQTRFTIVYDGGRAKYETEQTLQPDQQMWVDVGKLIHERVADKNGKTLPVDLTSGTYEWRDLTNKDIGVLFEGKIVYDKTFGHVTYGCAECCGYYGLAYLDFNPLGIPLLGTTDNGVNTDDSCDGGDVDDSSYFYGNWTTANTSIATVNYYGTHTGVAAGTTTSKTSAYLQAEGKQAPDCPVKFFSPSGTANVCDFTITPANVLAQDCTGSSQNSNNFTTTITPAGNSCLADQATSTCSETSTGNIDFVVGSPKCVYNLGNPSATVTYFAGPALGNGNAGTISMTFNLVFNGISDSHTDNATVECPQ